MTTNFPTPTSRALRNHLLNDLRNFYIPAYAEDRTAGSTSIKQPLENLKDAGLIYGQIVYDKAPIVMNMLLKLLGEEAFQKGIREYLQTYLYGNATWDNLITILNKYTDKDHNRFHKPYWIFHTPVYPVRRKDR